MPKINVIFHSVSGHTYKMAEAISEGVRSVSGCEAHIKRIPEPFHQEPIVMPGLDKRSYEFSHIPEATIEDLRDCDGIALGSAVYWGNMSYATKHYLDSAAKLWGFRSVEESVKAPKLTGKPATVFTGGGSGLVHDPAVLGMWTVLAYFGMTIVTVGLGVPEVSDPARFDGGSPLGAGVFSRRPGRHPTEAESAIARAQGRALGETTRAWVKRPSD